MDFKELAGSRCAPVSLVPACFKADGEATRAAWWYVLARSDAGTHLETDRKPSNNRGHYALPAICQPRRLKARAGATWQNYRQIIYWSTFGRSLGF
jgi:hypothetical protein